MIGYNSIVQNFLIKVKGSKKPVEVLVQANKNYGICDLYFLEGYGSEQLRSDLLSKVQGRQINDENVFVRQWNKRKENVVDDCPELR